MTLIKENKMKSAGCLFVLSILLFTGCNNKPTKPAQPASKGLPSELLLIVDAALWSTDTRDTLEAVLKAPMPGLPQYEPMFRLVKIFPENYSPSFSTFRNILEVRLNQNIKAPTSGIAHNINARPQTYLRITTPNADALKMFLSTNKDAITSCFVESELKREITELKKKHSKKVNDISHEMFGLNVMVPQDIIKIKRGKNFLWASSDRQEKDLNYICYILPLSAQSELSGPRWPDLRDSVMKRNIPGSTPEQWMTTAREKGIPLVEQSTATLPSGETVTVMRGLWEMHGGALGGPFVSLAFVDTSKARIIVNEGFIYSPSTNKRDLVRLMEAALRTLKK